MGLLRLSPRVEVCAQDDSDQVWLRGPALDDGLELQLRQLAGAQRFTVLPDGQLVPAGAVVPLGQLPGGLWQPLADWLQPILPALGWPGLPAQPVEWKLVRTTVFAEPSAVLVSLSPWREYAAIAPQVRLDRWTFAADAAGRVLVRGAPLPPLPGLQFVDLAGLLVPAGWMWSPAVEPDVVRELLQLRSDDDALFHSDGTWEQIRAGDWVRATRSAARATTERSDA